MKRLPATYLYAGLKSMMSIVTMASKYGVQLEGDEFDVTNLKFKINNFISSPEDFFFSTIREVNVLRTRNWDSAETALDAYQLAIGDINLLRSCLDVLDGCGKIGGGTVYRFREDGGFDMTRSTSFPSIKVRGKVQDLASPYDFHVLTAKAKSDRRIRMAFNDLTADASWIDIYRSWESLKEYYGGEHRVHRAFTGEEKRIKQLTRTANSFRHVMNYDTVTDPMPRGEAVSYLKQLLKKTASLRGMPPVPQAFRPGQQLHLPNLQPNLDQPAALKKLSLGMSAGSECTED